MGYNFYSFLVLIGGDSEISLQSLKEKLEDFYRNDERLHEVLINDNLLTLHINDWKLSIQCNYDPHVKQESAEMADTFAAGSSEKNLIAACNARLEISGDPDLNMEYFNDVLVVQQTIEGFENIFIFDSNNSQFLNI